MQSLAGKTALVTGASGGIGGAIARRLAGEGAAVALHYNGSEARVRETAAAIERDGGRCVTVGADLAESGAGARMFAALAEQGWDGLDILVNNAGLGIGATLADTGEDAFDRMFAINVKGVFFLTQAALPHLRDGGCVINISSMVSIVAYPSTIAYSMTKTAVNSFTRSLAADLASRQIRVNAVAPGATATDFIGHLLDNKEVIAAITGATALGRLGQPDDIAQVVAFLASPGGAWITGQVIQASGGMHL